MAQKDVTLKFIPELDKQQLRQMMEDAKKEIDIGASKGGGRGGSGDGGMPSGYLNPDSAEFTAEKRVWQYRKTEAWAIAGILKDAFRGAPGGTGGDTSGPGAGPGTGTPQTGGGTQPAGGIQKMITNLIGGAAVAQAVKSALEMTNYQARFSAGAAQMEAPNIAAMQSRDPTFLYKQKYMAQADQANTSSAVGQAAKDGIMTGLGAVLTTLSPAFGPLAPIAAIAGVGLTGMGGAGLIQGAATGGESWKARAASSRNELYENLQKAQPYNAMTLDYLKTNGQRDLEFQRSTGMSDRDLQGFKKETNNQGFLYEQSLGAAQGILGAGGTTASARENSVNALGMAREHDVTNAPQMLGTLGQRMAPQEANSTLQKILTAAVKSGFDSSEKMKYMQTVVGILASGGAYTGGGAAKLSEDLARMTPSNTTAGIQAAVSGMGVLNQLGSQNSGMRGFLQRSAMNADPALRKLGIKNQDALAAMLPTDASTWSEEALLPIAKEAGISVDQLREKMKGVKDNAMSVTRSGQATIDKTKASASTQYETNEWMRKNLFKPGEEGMAENEIQKMRRGQAIKTYRESVGYETNNYLSPDQAAAAGAGLSGLDVNLKQGQPGAEKRMSMMPKDDKASLMETLEQLSKPERVGDTINKAAAKTEAEYNEEMGKNIGEIAETTKQMLDLMKGGKNTNEAGKQLDFENRMKPTASEQYFDSLSDLKIGSG